MPAPNATDSRTTARDISAAASELWRLAVCQKALTKMITAKWQTKMLYDYLLSL
jgi:hypothetical protein